MTFSDGRRLAKKAAGTSRGRSGEVVSSHRASGPTATPERTSLRSEIAGAGARLRTLRAGRSRIFGYYPTPNVNINDDQDSSRWLLDGDLRLENTTEEGRDFLGFTLNVEEGFQRLFPLGQYLSSIMSPLGNVKMRVSGGFDPLEVLLIALWIGRF